MRDAVERSQHSHRSATNPGGHPRWFCGLTATLLLAFTALTASAATAVIIPRDKQAPDPSVLSLEEMSVDITIDNGDARIFITQIFLNHTNKIEEGTYNFALPSGSTVSDFAVWDGAVRIPAVILERKRAQEVYEQARLQAIDPGLLQMGERDNADPAHTALSHWIGLLSFTCIMLGIAAIAFNRREQNA